MIAAGTHVRIEESQNRAWRRTHRPNAKPRWSVRELWRESKPTDVAPDLSPLIHFDYVYPQHAAHPELTGLPVNYPLPLWLLQSYLGRMT
jgi:hypothetical protein